MTGHEEIVAAIEHLIVEGVGITTVALAQAHPDSELTMAQWRALVVVGSKPAGIRIGEIAARIGSAIPTTSRLVRRLEDRGFVCSERDESDRRATLARLTAAGEAIRGSLVTQRRELIRTSLSRHELRATPDLLVGLRSIGEALADYG